MENPIAEPYINAVERSLTRVIISGQRSTLKYDQVEEIMKNIVWEIERFIGSGVTAPSFNGKELGESELILRCADERTEEWLTMITPKLKPWKNASLTLITIQEWETMMSNRKMFRMSVKVPWRTTGGYFLDVLRAHNPELRTKYWDIKSIQDRGEYTMIFLKVDEISLESLRSRSFKAHWLLDELVFKLERAKTHPIAPTNETQKPKANKTLVNTGKPPVKDGGNPGETCQDKEIETGTPAILANLDLGKNLNLNENPPVIEVSGTEGASNNGQQTVAGTSGAPVINDEVQVPITVSTQMEQSIN